MSSILSECRKNKKQIMLSLSNSEIAEMVLFPVVNEAFRILAEGYCLKPSDIDIVSAFGYGFPRAKSVLDIHII